MRVPLIARNLLESIAPAHQHGADLRREVRRRHHGQRGGLPALGRVDAGRRHRAQPLHRLRQGGRDRQGGGQLGPPAARGRLREGRRRGDLRQGHGPAQDGAGQPLAAESASSARPPPASEGGAAWSRCRPLPAWKGAACGGAVGSPWQRSLPPAKRRHWHVKVTQNLTIGGNFLCRDRGDGSVASQR